MTFAQPEKTPLRSESLEVPVTHEATTKTLNASQNTPLPSDDLSLMILVLLEARALTPAQIQTHCYLLQRSRGQRADAEWAFEAGHVRSRQVERTLGKLHTQGYVDLDRGRRSLSPLGKDGFFVVGTLDMSRLGRWRTDVQRLRRDRVFGEHRKHLRLLDAAAYADHVIEQISQSLQPLRREQKRNMLVKRLTEAGWADLGWREIEAILRTLTRLKIRKLSKNDYL